MGFGVVGLGLGAGELVDGAGAGGAVVGACVACAGRAVGCRDGVGVGWWLVGAAVGDGWAVGDCAAVVGDVVTTTVVGVVVGAADG